jgi:hypothetical protein
MGDDKQTHGVRTPRIRMLSGRPNLKSALKLLQARETYPNPQPKQMLEFYWLFIRAFGRIVLQAGLRDFMQAVMFALCTGIAAFLLRDHDWRKGLIIAVFGIVLWLLAVSLGHFVKVPPILFYSQEAENTANAENRRIGFVGLIIVLFMLSVPIGLTWWWHSGHSLEIEPNNSLRRRTKAIADDVQHYLEDRTTNHPAYPNRNNTEPLTDEQKKILKTADDYDRETFNYYRDHYAKTMVAIVGEYKAKGVNTGFLDTGLINNIPWYGMPGSESVADTACMTDICKFRELAYHVDTHDIRVDIP